MHTILITGGTTGNPIGQTPLAPQRDQTAAVNCLLIGFVNTITGAHLANSVAPAFSCKPIPVTATPQANSVVERITVERLI